MYYSYCPENGIEFHGTAKQAESRAIIAMEAIEFDAADSDWHWHDRGDEVSWGEVKQKAEYNDRDLTPEEKAENPEWSFHRTYSLDDVPSVEVTDK